MQCPYCGYFDSKVIDSRPTEEGKSIRRRRSCLECNERFTTYEKIETTPVSVIKKDGRRQEFDKDKLVFGLLRACANRPIPREAVENLADAIEEDISSLNKNEVSTDYIAELALSKLKNLDEVSYIRFASVTNRFENIDTFWEFLNEMKKNK